MSNLKKIINPESSKEINTVSKRREKFENLESALFKLPQLTDEDYQLKEYYSGGMYCRHITIPKGAMITGRVYKFDHLETMISGSILIAAADGPKKHYQGFNVIEAEEGKRQAGLALEKTIWMTVCAVPEGVPLDHMLDYTTTVGYEEYYNYCNTINRLDYNKLLVEMNITEDEMTIIVNSEEITEMPLKYNNIYVSKSTLSGKGLFSNTAIKKGDLICPARILSDRTIAGRYSNHALKANSFMCKDGDTYFFRARKDIRENEEITCNYREVIGFRSIEGDL